VLVLLPLLLLLLLLVLPLLLLHCPPDVYILVSRNKDALQTHSQLRVVSIPLAGGER
jgi:hypothetical protein